jgi:hypothetical protein
MKERLAKSVVKCEESGGERERKRDSFYYGLLLLLLPSSSVVGMWGTTATVFFLDPDLTSIFYKKKIAFFAHFAAFVIPAFFFLFFCSYNMY